MTIEIMYDLKAEQATLGSLMLDPDMTPAIAEKLTPEDFGVARASELYRVMLSLFDQQMPYDTWLLLDEAKKQGASLDASFIIECEQASNSPYYAEHYAGVVKQYSEKRRHIAIANEYAQKIHGGMSAEDLNSWLLSAIAGYTTKDKASMSLAESLERQEELIQKWESPENKDELERWSWAWSKWNQFINPAPKGMLCVVQAADGVGKTIVGEVQAEHWAAMGNNVVYFHFELDRDVMITRRMSRLSGISYRKLVTNNLTPDEVKFRDEVKNYISRWTGNIEYVHCPGWDVDQMLNRAKTLQKQGLCDVIVVDYFQKIQPSPRQIRNRWGEVRIEEDTAEQMKIFSESGAGCRAVLLAQLNKEGKRRSADSLDRTAGRGAGAITEKSNVVVMLHKEMLSGGRLGAAGKVIVEPGGYDTKATVKINKNTLGRTGTIEQYSNGCFNWLDDEEA